MEQLLKSICIGVAVGMMVSCSIFKFVQKIVPFKYFHYLAPIINILKTIVLCKVHSQNSALSSIRCI